MSLKQDLDAINIATHKLLDDCNEVIGQYLPPVEVLGELPSRIEDVHGVGYTTGNDEGFAIGQQIGYDSGYEKGYEDGKAEGGGGDNYYDTFWDTYQDGGKRTVYSYAFYYLYWKDDAFKPKYDMHPTNAQDMFSSCGVADLKGTLETQGVVLDFSECTNLLRAFYGMSSNKRIGVVDMSAATDVRNAFMNSLALQSIDKLVFSEITGSGFSTGNTTMFQNCNSLETVTFEGTLCFSISLRWSPLSRASIESVMVALSDSVSGQTVTFSKAAVEAAFTTDEWNTLVASKPNWTITLA